MLPVEPNENAGIEDATNGKDELPEGADPNENPVVCEDDVELNIETETDDWDA